MCYPIRAVLSAIHSPGHADFVIIPRIRTYMKSMVGEREDIQGCSEVTKIPMRIE